MSTDSGVTWSQQGLLHPFPDNSIGVATDIDFIDGSHGLVSTESQAFLTSDQGLTWKRIGLGGQSCTFGLTPNILIIGDSAEVSSDGGGTWTRTFPTGYIQKYVREKNGEIFCLAGNSTTDQGNLFFTTDLGANWQTQFGILDWDTWSFAIDSCDANTIYAANEDAVKKRDGLSQVFVTPNGGATWSTPVSRPLNFLTGSIVTSNAAVYCQTIDSGIFRSTDRGKSWKSIGGPGNDYDTRMLVAISDNIIVASDQDGNVWRTTNSGGDSVKLPAYLSVSPSVVQFADSTAPCVVAPPMNVLIVKGCASAGVSHVKVQSSNADSNYFLATLDLSSDSVVVQFAPAGSRIYNADLVLTLSNDSSITIPLSGFGKAPPTISLFSNSAGNDTIGATVFVPVVMSPNSRSGILDLALHFDTSMLVYLGAFQDTNAVANQTGVKSPGLATLHFNLSDPRADSTLGYIGFRLFPLTTPCTSILFDSISITDGKSVICANTNVSFSANICSLAGCGATTLSDFLRYSKLPVLSLAPNPTSATTTLRTDTDLGEVSIEIYDVLGGLEATMGSPLSPASPISINTTTLASGLYSVRVRTAGFAASLRLLRIQ
jgi:photosystem II stability/assembly factor-like uncharacterized protein